MIASREDLSRISRFTIKIGTGVISPPSGGIEEKTIDRLVKDISSLLSKGYEIILISSGAIGAGFPELGLKKRPKDLILQQASSSIGQIKMISIYNFYFRKYGKKCAQILLTREDVENRERFLYARSTFLSLLKKGIVPIVNENDTVATEEIRYGDNDFLANMVTTLVNSQLLIILTDVKGLYPETNFKEPIKEIKKITPEIEKMVEKKGNGAGGMKSKVKVAEILLKAGIPVVIADGKEERIIRKIISGEEIGTIFLPDSLKYPEKKIWIGYLRKMKGWIKIDRGAEEFILKRGKSLLPSGIIDIKGDFKRGDTVSLLNEKGEEIARGLVNYSFQEVKNIKGEKTNEAEKILGYLPYEEIIHRDNLLILKERSNKNA